MLLENGEIFQSMLGQLESCHENVQTLVSDGNLKHLTEDDIKEVSKVGSIGQKKN